MIQLTRTGIVTDAEQLDTLRATFDRQHCALLPQFLAPDLLRFLQPYLAAAELSLLSHRTKAGQEIGTELAMRGTEKAIHVLLLLLNSSRLFRFVQGITGCPTIANFTGRIYRMLPGTEHYDSWHDDASRDRLIGLSINLSTEAYEGGVFQLRARPSKQMICEIANRGLGDAHLFRLAPHLEHQVTRIEGHAAKTACAGWFRSQPSFRAMLEGKEI